MVLLTCKANGNSVADNLSKLVERHTLVAAVVVGCILWIVDRQLAVSDRET